ncbi:MAG: NAD-dependent epimerase/dehydratase family protein [Myxococcota bacterium]
MRVGLLGAGYSGGFLARKLLDRGHQVVAGRRSLQSMGALEARGAETRSVDLSTGQGLADFAHCDVLVHLAPPPDLALIETEIERLARALGPKPLVYASTTGVFGRQPSGQWVDENTEPGPLQTRGERRVAYAAGLAEAGFEVRRVFVAGIYGPGRSMFESLKRGLILFENGPLTSRIHVEDLASILEAQLGPKGLDGVIACDEAPAPTLELARHAASMAGWTLPPVLDREEAKAKMSEMARELRLSGRRCRSLHRARLLPTLRYPSYREGLASCWLSFEGDR